jgi:hypothetical protein
MTWSQLLCLGFLAFAAAASGQSDLASGWVGTFDRPSPSQHHLLIEFASTPQGWVGGAEISVWASAAPLSFIRFDGRQVSFEAHTETDPGHWVFRGSISEDGVAIDGTVTLGPDSYPFRLERNDAALGLLAASAESIGEFDDGFAGRWSSKLPDANEHSYLQLVLRRTAYGFTGVRENWSRGRMIRKIEVNGTSVRFEMPKAAAVFEGMIDSTGMHLTSDWIMGAERQPFTLRRSVGDPGLGH